MFSLYSVYKVFGVILYNTAFYVWCSINCLYYPVIHLIILILFGGLVVMVTYITGGVELLIRVGFFLQSYSTVICFYL
jgi:hypothetical protein